MSEKKTTKVWVNDMGSEENAYQAVKASLKRLDMEYADLILLHQPMNDYSAAYRGITKAYKEGLTKAIGVANFYPAILANLCEAVEVIPAGCFSIPFSFAEQMFDFLLQ